MTTVSTTPETNLARPELIFAMVGPLGTRLTDLAKRLATDLDGFGYTVERIRVSDLLKQLPDWTPPQNTHEDDRITNLQKIANAARIRTKDGALLARAAIAEVRARRMARSGHPDRPIGNCAFLIDQLKHPEEARLLRRIYGRSFYLVGGHASHDTRVNALCKSITDSTAETGHEGHYKPSAIKLVETDDKSESAFGQNMRDTYPQSDIFIDMNPTYGESAISRFIDLIFGHPFHTPTPEEYAMYIASAVALRSADENRQVGAAIVDIQEAEGRIVDVSVRAVGMNEVPRAGGGFYWDGDSPDRRDQRILPDDPARKIKLSILTEVLGKAQEANLLGPSAGNGDSSAIARELMARLDGTQFMGIGEFSRPVHAEVAAIIDAARRGVAIDGRTIFVTAFPCHNCTKHILAAGLKKVIYLEPYPKSRAALLYGEELELDSSDRAPKAGKVVFSAYTGVAPRQYGALFAMADRGGKLGMNLPKWYNASRKELLPIHVAPHLQFGHVVAERTALRSMSTTGYKWDEAKICPADLGLSLEISVKDS